MLVTWWLHGGYMVVVTWWLRRVGRAAAEKRDAARCGRQSVALERKAHLVGDKELEYEVDEEGRVKPPVGDKPGVSEGRRPDGGVEEALQSEAIRSNSRKQSEAIRSGSRQVVASREPCSRANRSFGPLSW